MMDLERAIESVTPGLLRYCQARTGCVQLAEEAAQEALGALVERWRRHGPPENPAAFTFAIARRRSARLAWRRRLSQPLDLLFEPSDLAPGPLETTLQRDRLNQVRKALSRLSTRDREVILLVAAGELDQQSTAQTLGLSVSAVKMRLSRARRRLQGLLEVVHEPA